MGQQLTSSSSISQTVSQAVSWTVKFDHAAIATRDPAKLKRVLSLIGLEDCGVEPVPSQGINTHFLRPDLSRPAVEILEPVAGDGVVARYLDKKGAGIHHLCFSVSDIQAVSNMLRQEGIRLTYAEPQKGAHGAMVNFIHPESTGGILIELSQINSEGL